MKFNGNFLPWVKKFLHLGNTITNQKDCIKTDMSIKTAKYVSKNIEINQEFSFASPKTRLKINSIYNLSWYGSTLWNLFGSNAIKVESSYNRSIMCSLNLPYTTHRYLIKPISERRHVKWLLISRFQKYMEKIEKSKKPILKVLKEATERDVMSRTGGNMRKIMLLVGKSDISDVTQTDIDNMKYFPISHDDKWKLELINLLVEELESCGSREDASSWLEILCFN